MAIRPLNWECTSLRNIRYNGIRTTTETWEAKNEILGDYKVYSSINRKCFVYIPVWFTDKITGMKSLVARRKVCKSIQHGKDIAEIHWQEQLKGICVQ